MDSSRQRSRNAVERVLRSKDFSSSDDDDDTSYSQKNRQYRSADVLTPRSAAMYSSAHPDPAIRRRQALLDSDEEMPRNDMFGVKDHKSSANGHGRVHSPQEHGATLVGSRRTPRASKLAHLLGDDEPSAAAAAPGRSRSAGRLSPSSLRGLAADGHGAASRGEREEEPGRRAGPPPPAQPPHRTPQTGSPVRRDQRRHDLIESARRLPEPEPRRAAETQVRPTFPKGGQPEIAFGPLVWRCPNPAGPPAARGRPRAVLTVRKRRERDARGPGPVRCQREIGLGPLGFSPSGPRPPDRSLAHRRRRRLPRQSRADSC